MPVLRPDDQTAVNESELDIDESNSIVLEGEENELTDNINNQH